jgi:hypothetical protein
MFVIKCTRFGATLVPRVEQPSGDELVAKRRETLADFRSSSQPRKRKDGVESKEQTNSENARPLAKSADPAYMKLTTYVRKTTHLAVKTRLVSKKKELSDLVEELLSDWLKKNSLFRL